MGYGYGLNQALITLLLLDESVIMGMDETEPCLVLDERLVTVLDEMVLA